MIKLLIDHLDDIQRVELIDASGSYFDKSRVIWDEREDGPMPQKAIDAPGGWTKDGNDLVQDLGKKTSHDAALAVIEAQDAEREQLRNALKRVDDISNLADAKVFLKKLVKYISGLDQGA